MTGTQIQAIRTMKEQGIRVREIARRIGCSVASVNVYARDIPSHHSDNKHISKEVHDFIVQSRKSGMTIRETAEKAGVCPATVQRHQGRDMRVPRHTPHSKARTAARWQQALAMRDLGMSFDQIARRLGCKAESVPVMICRYKHRGDK